MLERLKKLYKEYDEAAYAARKKSTFFDNFLGTGSAAQKHPCHEQFYEDMNKVMEEYVATEPEAAEAVQVSLFMLEEPAKHREHDSYWFMYVCLAHIRELIPFMGKEDCAMLAEKMGQLYKKRDRMPVQEDTYKKLLKAAK